MKRIYLYLLLLGSYVIGYAQEAKPILSPAIKYETKEWYQEQEKLWKQKTIDQPKNEDNWLQYVRAVYYSKPEESDLDLVYKELQAKIPNSFPYYYLKHRVDSGSDAYLDSAYNKNPEYPDLWEAQFVRALKKGDKGNQVLFAQKLLNSDEEDVSLYHWAYNVLNSLEQNAIIFTHGDNDSFGAWILQESKNIRTDVDVINTSLLMDSTYCKRYWKSNFPDEKWISMGQFYNENKIEWDNGYAYMRWLMKKYAETDRAIHITTWTPEYLKRDFDEEDLFLTGLTYRYDPERKFSTIAALRKNFEQVYKLDYIEQRYFSNIWDEKATYLNKSYLSGLLKLYVHYEKTGEGSKLEKVKHLIQVIEPDKDKLGEYGDYIKRETGQKPMEFNGLYVDTKHLLKKYKQIDENLFASATEESNAEYRLFLDNLEKNDTEKFAKCRPDSTLFRKTYDYAYNDPMVNLYHWHPAYDNYPTVNISLIASKEYCTWLTLQYNNDPKRKINEVLFFLPNEAQWKKAAGELKRIKNEKECYLVNGYLEVEGGNRLYDDGGFHMVKVDSYLKNENELFCIYGNVSELIADQNYSKGGGWFTEYKKMGKDNQHETGPHPTVGFRVFMKIIQK